MHNHIATSIYQKHGWQQQHTQALHEYNMLIYFYSRELASNTSVGNRKKGGKAAFFHFLWTL
jgi:hypothetical protein